MDILTESGLSSRFLRYDNEHDCAFISAYRTARDCGQGKRYTKRENLQRSTNLLYKLISRRYRVISVLGQFRDGRQDSSERTFFVLNQHDSEQFAEHIISFGEDFEQDAVLIIPKGALQGGGKSRTYYARTNACENNFLRLLNKEKKFFGRTLINREIKAFFSRVSGRDAGCIKKIKAVTQHRDAGNIMGLDFFHRLGQEDWEETEICLSGFSLQAKREPRREFYIPSQEIPEYVACDDDVNDFIETVMDGFGGRDNLYRLTGAKGERYGVDWYGNFWMLLPMAPSATNGASSCYITYYQDDDVYTVRFLSGRLDRPNDLMVISEHVGLDIHALKPVYQEETNSYLSFD